jgi:hypothetical protein
VPDIAFGAYYGWNPAKPQQGHAFFSPQDAILFMGSILAGLIVAAFVGMKYYRYVEKRNHT